jgi:hypothetical protein
MKEIQLTRDKIAIVDDDMFEELSKYKWYYHHTGYATRLSHPKIYMHRIVACSPEGMDTDHANGNKLDNRRENLRVCTCSENHRNRVAYHNNTSGYKGVYWRKQSHKWMAQINVNRKFLYLGLFDSPEEAARFYDLAALAYFGDFANTNFEVTYG